MANNHTLMLHPAWDKGMSANDRHIFSEWVKNIASSPNCYCGVVFKSYRTGINYEGHLYATVLINNFTDEPLRFQSTVLQYKIKDKTIAEHEFHISDLKVNSHTSTPWTFIFPNDTITKDDTSQRMLATIVDATHTHIETHNDYHKNMTCHEQERQSTWCLHMRDSK